MAILQAAKNQTQDIGVTENVALPVNIGEDPFCLCLWVGFEYILLDPVDNMIFEGTLDDLV